MSIEPTHTEGHVLIAGGGVAAIEAALALKELAGDQVRISMLATSSTFIYRPELVGEPFSRPAARSYPLAAIASDLDIDLHTDSLQWVDSQARVVHTAGGDHIAYDALLLAVGASRSPGLSHAVTLSPDSFDEQMHGIVQDLEGGYIKSVAFVIPQRSTWPLPIYELALMSAQRASQMNVRPAITLVTPERAPLAVFGDEASAVVRALLDRQGIDVMTSTQCSTLSSGQLTTYPVIRNIQADAIVALPVLSGPTVAGIPRDASHGFVKTDREGHVVGVDRVFAAGDMTDFPIKHGGIAAQQADSAATSIAAQLGVKVEPDPLVAELCGLLWDGERPIYLRARVSGTHGSDSQVSGDPLWDPPGKIQARYLGPYLDSLDRELASQPRPGAAPGQVGTSGVAPVASRGGQRCEF